MFSYAKASKMLVLGIDGFEPRLATKYLKEGKMPALAQFIQRGACREDLFMLGGVPTVTPPLWTTLATGACRILTASPVFLVNIQKSWIKWCIIWILGGVKRSLCGMC